MDTTNCSKYNHWRGVALLTFSALLTISLAPTSLAKDVHSVESSVQLQCPPCERIQCFPKRAKRLKCKGGVTRGVCNCCPICAKVEGEACGGYWNSLGKCDKGLSCDYQLKTWDPNRWRASPENIPEGICRVSMDKLTQMDQPYQPVNYCKPKCTPKYCQQHRKAICSAVDNAEEKQDCQGDCQHTSCSACRFVMPTPKESACSRCRHDDFACMRTFAKCIKRDVCSRDKFPCRINEEEDKMGAKFQCIVPECLP